MVKLLSLSTGFIALVLLLSAESALCAPTPMPSPAKKALSRQNAMGSSSSAAADRATSRSAQAQQQQQQQQQQGGRRLDRSGGVPITSTSSSSSAARAKAKLTRSDAMPRHPVDNGPRATRPPPREPAQPVTDGHGRMVFEGNVNVARLKEHDGGRNYPYGRGQARLPATIHEEGSQKDADRAASAQVRINTNVFNKRPVTREQRLARFDKHLKGTPGRDEGAPRAEYRPAQGPKTREQAMREAQPHRQPGVPKGALSVRTRRAGSAASSDTSAHARGDNSPVEPMSPVSPR